jgi:hypothetical protein
MKTLLKIIYSKGGKPAKISAIKSSNLNKDYSVGKPSIKKIIFSKKKIV